MTRPLVDPGATLSDAGLWSWLTQREREVLDHVALGLSAKSIAQTLSIAPRTVERHIDHIRLKTRTRNRAHMVAVAIASGCLDRGATPEAPAIALADAVGRVS